MQKARQFGVFLKRRWRRLLILLLLLAGLLIVFFPRRLDGLVLTDKADVAAVEVVEFPTGDSEPVRYELDGPSYDAFLSLLQGTYARLQVPHRASANGGGTDFRSAYIAIRYHSRENNEKLRSVSLFTRDIITVDGVQYRLYGGGFYDRFQALLPES